MPIMTHRKTFILDEATVHCLKRLAAQWQVSQTDVLRRAVALAEASLQADLEDNYRAVAADEAREMEALAWSEALIGDAQATVPE